MDQNIVNLGYAVSIEIGAIAIIINIWRLADSHKRIADAMERIAETLGKRNH